MMRRHAATAALFATAWAAVSAAAPVPEWPTGEAPGVAAGFAQAQTPRTFEFPRDHGPHPEFRQEWWYVTGNLDGERGQRFGFELTFFRFALAPPAAPTQAAGGATRASSAWRTRQIYMAHFAVTDVAAQRFRFGQKLSRDALGLGGAQSAPFKVWIDDWSLAAVDGTKTPAAAHGPRWTLHAHQPGYELELELEPLGAPVPNGEAGLSRKSAEPDSASYYYSIPRIAARGHLVRDGTRIPVQGLAWLDREWGSGTLGTNEVGWDWFALQLGDGSTLMFYALRDRNGGRDPASAGTWVAASGAARPLTDRQVQITATGDWSDAQGVSYPSGWRVRVPDLSLDLELAPALADQELRTEPRYWEGAVDVRGTGAGGAVTGRGYVELVGYARNGGLPAALARRRALADDSHPPH